MEKSITKVQYNFFGQIEIIRVVYKQINPGLLKPRFILYEVGYLYLSKNRMHQSGFIIDTFFQRNHGFRS